MEQMAKEARDMERNTKRGEVVMEEDDTVQTNLKDTILLQHHVIKKIRT